MKNKFSSFRLAVLSAINIYNVIVLTETWLVEEMGESEVFVPGYCIYRCDRDCISTGKCRGGGVMILVKDVLKSQIEFRLNEGLELLVVSILLNDSVVKVCAVYIAPLTSFIGEGFLVNYVNLVSKLRLFFEGICTSSLILAGDFNLPGFVWKNEFDGCFATGYNSNLDIYNALRMFEEFINYFGMKQVINVVNSNGYMLDLLFSNISEFSSSMSIDPLLPIDIHHPPFEITFSLSSEFMSIPQVSRFNFYKVDYNKLNNELLDLDWSALLDCSYADKAVDIFYTKIFDLISCFVPVYKCKFSEYPKWFNGEVIKAINKKNRLHKIYKMFNNFEDYLLFKNQRAICRKLVKEAYHRYISSIEQNLLNDPKSFWSIFRPYPRTFPCKMFYKDSILHTPYAVADAFADFFSGNFSDSLSVLPYEFDYHHDGLSYLEFSIDTILEKLESLKVDASPGPDGLHPMFLKECSHGLVRPVHHIFNLILKSGSFPNLWKHSYVTPVFKKNDKNCISNYRPICKVSVLAKVFDCLLHGKLLDYLKPVISEHQHGFFPGRSVLSNLASFSNVVVNALNLGHQVDVVYTDLKSAFDTLNHLLIIRKLEFYGIRDPLLSVIRSFLIGRTLSVKIDGVLSQCYTAKSGVPQGSHCGPLLFNICINDLISVVKNSHILLFADDCKVFRVIRNSQDVDMLQEDLDKIYAWCLKSGLCFNIDKCLVMSFYKSSVVQHNYKLHDYFVKRANSVMDLGVLMDSNFLFTNHIDFIIAKASRSLGFIYRNTLQLRNARSFLALYIMHVRSVLSYCSVIWYPRQKFLIDKLESVQHRFLRILAFKVGKPMDRYSHNYVNIATEYSVCTIRSFHEYQCAIFLFKVLRGYVDSPVLLGSMNFHVPPRLLRSSNCIMSLCLMKNSLNHCYVVNRCGSVLNKIANCVDIFNDTIGVFKIKSRELLFNFN